MLRTGDVIASTGQAIAADSSTTTAFVIDPLYVPTPIIIDPLYVHVSP